MGACLCPHCAGLCHISTTDENVWHKKTCEHCKGVFKYALRFAQCSPYLIYYETIP